MLAKSWPAISKFNKIQIAIKVHQSHPFLFFSTLSTSYQNLPPLSLQISANITSPSLSFSSSTSFSSSLSSFLPQNPKWSSHLLIKFYIFSLCIFKEHQDNLTNFTSLDHLGLAPSRARRDLSQFQGFSEVEPPKISSRRAQTSE